MTINCEIEKRFTVKTDQSNLVKIGFYNSKFKLKKFILRNLIAIEVKINFALMKGFAH